MFLVLGRRHSSASNENVQRAFGGFYRTMGKCLKCLPRDPRKSSDPPANRRRPVNWQQLSLTSRLCSREREKLLLLWTAPKLSTPPPIQPPRESPCPPTLRSRPSSRRGPGCAMLSSLLPTGTPTPPATASSVFGTSSLSQPAAIPAGSIGQLFISLERLLARSRLCASEIIESIEGRIEWSFSLTGHSQAIKHGNKLHWRRKD